MLAALIKALSTFSSNEPTTPPYSYQHIQTIRILLMRLVPPELADVILDMAEFWCSVKLSYATDEVFIVPSDSARHGRSCIILTPELHQWIPVKAARLRRVSFTMESHDQGWTSESINVPGEYAGSWTWWEAKIVRAFNRPELSTEDVAGAICEALKADRVPAALVTAQRFGGTDAWHIQSNARAKNDFRVHNVVWTCTDEQEEDDIQWRNETGKGKGSGFIQSLQPTDRIGMVARAMYPGWQNIIRSAQLEIFYAI